MTTNHLTGILKLRMYLQEAMTKRTGPNDVFCVVWAISKFFLILFVFFINTNHLTGILNLRMYLREATMKRTSPNNVFCVVWAISKCYVSYILFFFLFVFFISINKLTGINDMDVHMGGYDEEIGPKRHISRRLGH